MAYFGNICHVLCSFSMEVEIKNYSLQGRKLYTELMKETEGGWPVSKGNIEQDRIKVVAVAISIKDTA